MNKPLILVVEDDNHLRTLICTVLGQNGYTALPAENGERALSLMDHQHVDLILTDLMMPEMDGYDLTHALRESGFFQPILIVTAKEAFADKERGFTAGADDYMVKPIDLGEMVLRVGALLRRAHAVSEHLLAVGGATLDYNALTVARGDEKLTLPKKEFYLLYKLVSNPGMIFTRLQLMDEIWGMDSDADERTVDVHIKRLRDKFKDWPDFRLVTIRGLGYKAEVPA